MQIFRDLVKKKNKSGCNATLGKLFSDSRSLVITKVQEGIKTFDINKRICHQEERIKAEIVYLLLQQHCSCPPTSALVCCPEGWCLVLAGSQITTELECRYVPTEGECLAISWSINNARIFILRAKKVRVVTLTTIPY